MNQNAPMMFSAAKPRVVALLSEFEPHRICNTVWAYAKTGNTDLELFRLIAEESIRKMHRFNHSNESMLLYSYALGHVHAPVLFRKAMSQQLPAIQSGDVQDPRSLSNLLWAISELNLANEFPRLYETVRESAISNIHRYSVTHMATIASAYAKANIRADDLFGLMALECNNRPINDSSVWSDLVVLNDAYVHFGIDSGVVKSHIESMVNESKTVHDQARQEKIRGFVVDLVGTSVIAATVLVVAALVKIYLGKF